MNETTRLYPFDVRPQLRETLDSYSSRLLAANFEDEQHKQYLLRQTGARTVAEQHTAWVELLTVKTKRTELRFDADEHGWLRHPDGSSCPSCANLLPARRMCTHCARGAVVEQHPHFDTPVCLTHHRWVGITNTPTEQHQVGAEHIAAALTFVKLRRRHKVDVRFYFIALHALATENSTHQPTYREADMFPETIALIWHLTRDAFVTAFFDPAVTFKTAYAVLCDTVERALQRRAPRVSRAFWLYLRGTVATLRTALLLGEPYTAAHAHDYPLNPRLAERFSIPAAGLEPFTHYLHETNDTPETAIMDTLVLAEQRLIPETAALNIRHRELAICSNGHQFEAPAATAGIRPSKPKHPTCPICRGHVVIPRINDLQSTHPDVAAEFDTERNGGLTAIDVSASSHEKYQWCCPKGHSYTATAVNRTSAKSKCPVCLQRVVIAGVNDVATTHPDVAATWHPSFLLTKPPTTLPSGSKEWILWLCENEHAYEMQLFERCNGRECPECKRTRTAVSLNNLTLTHPALAAEWHPVANGSRRPEQFTAGSREQVCWLCPKGHSYWTRIERRAHGYNCKVCSHRALQTSVNDLATTDALLAAELLSERNSTSAEGMFAGTERVWWQCRTANHVYEQSVPNRRKTRGCPKCPPYLRIMVTSTQT